MRTKAIMCCVCQKGTELSMDAGTSSAPVVEMVEEVIAEHPAPPLSPYTPGTKLATRAPVHAALTASIRSHFPGLPEVQPMHDGCDAAEPPRPQVR